MRDKRILKKEKQRKDNTNPVPQYLWEEWDEVCSMFHKEKVKK